MYLPRHFEVTDQSEIHGFIAANAFGQLISTCAGRLFSSHIPFLLSDDNTALLGHLARQNPQSQDIAGQEVLVTLQGPHDYVSPSWYESPGVPTWNYQAVHIYGRCAVFDDPDTLRELVSALTRKYESDLPTPWQAEYKQSLLGAITGIRIAIAEIQCKYKLGQNRSARDRERVIEQLKARGSHQLAAAMQRNERGAT